MWTMWAGNSHGYFSHPVPNKSMAKLYASEEEALVEVEVREDPAGTYFGWIDAERESGIPSMIWPSRCQVEMCFPYGTKGEVERGKGRVVQLSVTRKQPEESL